VFWGYDGTALLCAPPRLYNMMATSVALSESPLTTVEEMSCYLAYINVAMADAGVASSTAKFNYLYPQQPRRVNPTWAGQRALRMRPRRRENAPQELRE